MLIAYRERLAPSWLILILFFAAFSGALPINTGLSLERRPMRWARRTSLSSSGLKPGEHGSLEILKYEFRSQWLPKRVQVFVSPSRLLLMVKSK
jgi:hypothetical protein